MKIGICNQASACEPSRHAPAKLNPCDKAKPHPKHNHPTLNAPQRPRMKRFVSKIQNHIWKGYVCVVRAPPPAAFDLNLSPCPLPFPGSPAGFSCVRSLNPPLMPPANDTLDSPNLSLN